jgi:hypothetical protein
MATHRKTDPMVRIPRDTVRDQELCNEALGLLVRLLDGRFDQLHWVAEPVVNELVARGYLYVSDAELSVSDEAGSYFPEVAR